MKLLHTADWHLGQRFLHRDRHEEHDAALNWLIDTINREKIDVLIIAGDVFDVNNPPNYALKQYYDFLEKILNSNCKNIIVVGGNHDSPSVLDAPKELLRSLKVHVVGRAVRDEGENIKIEEEIFELKDEHNQLIAVMAAIPYLRDRDLKYAVSGETANQRADSLKQGIYQHYDKARKEILKYKHYDIPIIATGHLFAAGGKTSDSENDIHIGNLGQINGDNFPKEFDYIALGHLHRAQTVGEKNHVRYSGSLIPLNFNETKYEKVVLIAHFSGSNLEKVQKLRVPMFRRLLQFTGNFNEIKQQLEAYDIYSQQREAWAEVTLELDKNTPNLEQKVKKLFENKKIELLKILVNRNYQTTERCIDVSLDDMNPADVFVQKCKSEGKLPLEIEELKQTFRELYTLVTERAE
jgi:exonuclease SbcD